MASLVLGAVGSAVGAGFGGAILGLSGATIGGMIGSAVGSVVDSWIVGSLQPDQRYEGARLDSLRVTSATEGTTIPRVFGRMRLGGNIIWATDFTEHVSTTTQGGGKGGGPSVTTTEYSYTASFAVALCEGPITGIGRIWADGELLDTSTVTWRWYPGDEAQAADPFIAAKMGAEGAPAYRGTAYVVFEELDLTPFGNRIPQLSFEVFRPLADPDTAEGEIRAVTMIPGAGEFVYATEPVMRTEGATTTPENVHVETDRADFLASLDRLEALAPAVESVSLVVAWFGNDLRAGECEIRPGIETSVKSTTPQAWLVNGVDRASANLVSTDAEGRPVYGGTPSDSAVVQAIKEMKARGYRVTFYPFLLMDVPEGNALPNPYSDNAATLGQPALPWRGRITCSPAAGYAGSVDKTAAAASQVAGFFGSAAPADFTVVGETVSWTGGNDWGWRRMILHYAHLCAAAGGVDAFVIGSELRGLTTIRDSATSYPAVAELQSLAADVRSILGAGTKISYAADWSEYFKHQPADGSGDVFFHLDPLWSDANIDFVGIDNYMPLSDWRDGFEHADAAEGWPAIYDRAYLQANIAGGEGFDWFYASDADRAAQIRTPITDGAYGKPWVFRPKDMRAWWSNQHHDRPGGVESGTPTAWVPESKPIRFTEFGCPAVDSGTNQPNVFHDPKSSESALPHFSRGWQDEAIQRACVEAMLGYWVEPTNNPVSSVYGAPMIEIGEAALWTWDARPFPDFPARADVWSDAANWRLGHWMTGRLGAVGLGALVRDLSRAAGLPDTSVDVSELTDPVPGYVVSALESPRASIALLARHFGFDAVESGGKIVFRARGRPAVATLSPARMAGHGRAEVMELTRGQETELPQALKWQLMRADEEYDTATVEARRTTVQAARVASESFPLAVSLEDADRRARRALMEVWVGREALTATLPPSLLGLDPGDVITLDHDGRQIDYRISRIADAGARAIDAIRADARIYDLPPGQTRPARLPTLAAFAPAEAALMDLPQLTDAIPPHRPYASVFATPWYGTAAVWRSADTSGFQLLETIGAPARMGTLAADLPAGPLWRFDMGGELLLDLTSGTLASVTDTELLNGANALAVESAPGAWEVLQFGNAELVSSGRYRLTRLLRGQRGTEDAMGAPAPVGARVVILDAAIQPLPIAEADVGMPWNWRIGPGNAAPSDAIMLGLTFTPNGRGLVPFAPAQPRMRREANGDLAIRWIRRDRALAADSWVQTDVPMSEANEAYDLEILNAGTVVRTVSGLSAPAFTYTVANQTADFGAAVSSVDVRIFQNGSLGRGVPFEATLIITEAV